MIFDPGVYRFETVIFDRFFRFFDANFGRFLKKKQFFQNFTLSGKLYQKMVFIAALYRQKGSKLIKTLYLGVYRFENGLQCEQGHQI